MPHALADHHQRARAVFLDVACEKQRRTYAFTYDLLIKTVVDESQPIATNKKRDHDADFRGLVDREIELLYARFELPFRRLEFGDEQVLADTIATVRTGLDLAASATPPA